MYKPITFTVNMETVLPLYIFRTRVQNGQEQIFDPVRKKFIAYTPEETVRQRWIRYLSEEMQFPISLMSVEKKLAYNQRTKRSDLVVYDLFGKPILLLECKAPEVTITEGTFQQAAMYHATLQVSYLLLSNGAHHVLCHKLPETGQWQFLRKLPAYPEL